MIIRTIYRKSHLHRISLNSSLIEVDLTIQLSTWQKKSSAEGHVWQLRNGKGNKQVFENGQRQRFVLRVSDGDVLAMEVEIEMMKGDEEDGWIVRSYGQQENEGCGCCSWVIRTQQPLAVTLEDVIYANVDRVDLVSQSIGDIVCWVNVLFFRFIAFVH